MPTPFRTVPLVQKSAYDDTKSLIHGFRLRCHANTNVAADVAESICVIMEFS